MRIISGEFRNRILFMPKGLKTRPTASKTRACVFNILQSSIEGAEFLDICAGSGAMGIEGLSRGAHHATFIDHSKDALEAIKKNIHLLEIDDRTSVMFSDAYTGVKKLDKQGKSFDVAYFDPPYTKKETPSSFIVDVVMLFEKSPTLLVKNGILFVEDTEQCPIDTMTFENLALVSSRQMGDTVLREFKRL